jgi:hypothetical protein
MWLSGLTVDIACFVPGASTASPPEFPAASQLGFMDRFSVFPELEKLSLPPWSFSAEIGDREAFGHLPALCAAVLAFRKLSLVPRLFTTGVHFHNREQTIAQLEQVAGAGVQQIVLRLNEDEARQLSSDRVRDLVDACASSGIDLRLQLEVHETFSENCCRIARTIEDRQFTVTVLPIRIRPTRQAPLERAPSMPAKERVQLVLDRTGDLLLRTRTKDEIVDVLAGNVQRQPLHELIAAARASR